MQSRMDRPMVERRRIQRYRIFDTLAATGISLRPGLNGYAWRGLERAVDGRSTLEVGRQHVEDDGTQEEIGGGAVAPTPFRTAAKRLRTA
jgi:hypothetical protein